MEGLYSALRSVPIARPGDSQFPQAVGPLHVRYAAAPAAGRRREPGHARGPPSETFHPPEERPGDG